MEIYNNITYCNQSVRGQCSNALCKRYYSDDVRVQASLKEESIRIGDFHVSNLGLKCEDYYEAIGD